MSTILDSRSCRRCWLMRGLW